MGLQKGKTNNPEGRPAGVPNKVTADLRERIEKILNVHFTDTEIKKDLSKLDPEKRLNVLIRLLEFSLPKLRSTELTTDFDMLSDDDLNKIIESLKNANYETTNET